MNYVNFLGVKIMKNSIYHKVFVVSLYWLMFFGRIMNEEIYSYLICQTTVLNFWGSNLVLNDCFNSFFVSFYIPECIFRVFEFFVNIFFLLYLLHSFHKNRIVFTFSYYLELIIINFSIKYVLFLTTKCT